ncbi:MAG: 5-(carboxyamino)imidazole ribonucleotide mutase [Spirochaetaceae bacterium]|nr:5-(carboxyamino)imidazole ribonucleotide mutase [Spirochaetaceae bacterium]
MKVGIIMGSGSDKDAMKSAGRVLDEFGVSWSAHVISAHRAPELLRKQISKMESEGVGCFIAGAGLAAHLPGVIASLTTVPVVGVPLKAALDGMDSLLSIVQMPKGIPVATVGINNSTNAALLAVQFLYSDDNDLQNKMKQYRMDMKEKMAKENKDGVVL